MIRAECNSRGTPRCKVVYTHARTTFQGARNIEMHDRVSVYVFRCTKKSVPMLAIIIDSFCFSFCHQKSLDILNIFLCGMHFYGILNKMLDVVRDIGKLVKPRSHPYSPLLPGWNSYEIKNESKGRDSDVLSKTPDFKRRVLFFYHK